MGRQRRSTILINQEVLPRQQLRQNVPKRRGETCADAVEVSWCEIMDSSPLELKGAGTVDSRDRSVGLLHPVDQPLDFTVTAERVPPKVSESQKIHQVISLMHKHESSKESQIKKTRATVLQMTKTLREPRRTSVL